MFENELKFKIENDKLFQTLLNTNAIIFTSEKHQIDSVWIKKDSDGMNLVSGEPVVRTREQNGKITLTLKIEKNLGVFEEFETVVDNLSETNKILQHLGMRKLVTIDKTRKTASLDGFNLCYDYVENLGSFLEVEFLTEQPDPDGNKKILDFAQKFNLTENDVVQNTYNTLLCRKFNLK
ncbi:MAG: class IV adenylate cyclase [Clostridia bacterium]|nr:class IV adenylate cyclase [Clostridia bacterium]